MAKKGSEAMNSQFRLKLWLLLSLALIAIAPTPALAQPGCEELNDVGSFDYRSYGIGVHRTCGDFDPICAALRLKQIALGKPIEAWISLSREAALSAGVSPIPPNIRNQVEHLYPAPLLDKVRFKSGSGFLGTLQWFREEMSGGAITLDNIIIFSDDSRAGNLRIWVHELEHVRQYEQLGVDGFAQAYVDQTCILPGDTPAGGYDSGNCQLERRAVRKSNFWNRTDLAAYCTFFWRYVDAAYTGANGAPDGTAGRPYPDLTTGVKATVAGSILWVQPGAYSVDGNRLSKRMAIRAPRGGVNIRARPTVAGSALTSLSAASYNGELARESIAAAFGEDLASETAVANSLPLPTTLAGVTVKVKDSAGVERNAPLFFVSPGQINYLIPSGTASGIASIGVQKGASIVASETLPIAAVAPGLFAANANGQGVAAAVALRVRANGAQSVEPVARFDQQAGRFVSLPIDLGPADEQVFLILFGTGFRGHSGLGAIKVSIGGEPAETLFAGESPGFAGLDQANVRLPRSLAGKGEVGILFTVDNRSANEVTVSVC
jgi:uncharacterized protein (TIGR03437 family)